MRGLSYIRPVAPAASRPIVRSQMNASAVLPSRAEAPEKRQSRRDTAGRRLLAAFEAVEAFPALRRSRDEMLAAIQQASSDPGRLLRVVESDPALAIAVLRAGARSARGSRPADVPAALALLAPEQL